MLYARRLIFALSTALGVWVLVSFAGTMVGPAHSAFWTSSLMWSLLTSLLLSPALLVVAHYVSQASRSDWARRAARREAGPHGQEPSRSGNDLEDEERSGTESPHIWPEPPDREEEWTPPDDASREEWPWTREDVDRPE
jgi:hypothetical protein